MLAVLALALRQGMAQVAGMRRLQDSGRRALRPSMVVYAAGSRFAPSLASVTVVAAALAPFVVLGDVPGNEITHTAAAVILGGLVTTTLWNLLLLPALCLALAPEPPELEMDLLDLDPLGLPAPLPVATQANGNGNGNGHPSPVSKGTA
jgi:Cu/Ag efflux pump CusA